MLMFSDSVTMPLVLHPFSILFPGSFFDHREAGGDDCEVEEQRRGQKREAKVSLIIRLIPRA